MDYFNYRDQKLYVENCSVSEIIKHYGTPCFIYSHAALETAWQAFERELKQNSHLICYAVKANSNLSILNLLAKWGAGFDIVSVGELERVLRAGGDPNKIIFSGVAKKQNEIQRALEIGIKCFNVESIPELDRINDIAKQQNTSARIALRVNPNISVDTHPYITTGLNKNKFGVGYNEALAFYEYAATLPYIQICGIAYHIGSQLGETAPFCAALNLMLELLDDLTLRGITIEHLDLGGGLGVQYQDEQIPTIGEYLQALLKVVGNKKQALIFAPGRALVGQAGILITQIEYIKKTPKKNFAIVDAGMNDLLRPALYHAWHAVNPVEKRAIADSDFYDIVGPVCETSDFLAKNRHLSLKADDLLAVMTAGAYGFSMSSNYNSRTRAAEVLIDDNKMYLIRSREKIEDLFRGENIPLVPGYL